MTKQEKLISLVLEYQKTKNKDVLEQIIELNKNLINWYLNNTELNISRNELYNLIIKGMIISILNYKEDKNDNIIRYLSVGIRNTIDVEVNPFIRSRKILFETFLDYKRLIESKYKVTLEKDFSIFDDIIDLMQEDNLFRENDTLEVKRRILKILKTYQGSLNTSDFSNSLYPFEFPYDIDNLNDIMIKSLSNLEYNILCFSYGLFNNPKLSLDEISKKYNLCISSVKLYKDISLRKLKGSLDYYFNKKEVNMDKVEEFLTNILTKEEYIYFKLENIVSQKEIALRFNVSTTYVSLVINNALMKISFALNNYNKVIPELTLIKPYLESTLSDLEFKVFTSNYGLFGHEKLNIDKINKEYDINNIRLIYEINRNIKCKIQKTFNTNFDKEKVNEFLTSILSNLEYKVFTMYYDNKINQKNIAKELNISRFNINEIIQTCIEKIKVMINLSSSNYDLSKVDSFLKSILDDNEYLVLCYKYGLYNYDKLTLKDIAKVLKISEKEVIIMNNLLTIKLKRYLTEYNSEKILAIK